MGKKGKNKAKGTVAAGEEQGGDQTTPAVSACEAPIKGGKRTKDEIDDIFAVVKKAKPDEVCAQRLPPVIPPLLIWQALGFCLGRPLHAPFVWNDALGCR